jgi:DeoR family transcriptional regulator of aga operon
VSRDERWNQLLLLLGQRGRVSVAEAAEALDVSAATVRRDFDELARQQMLTRTHGGAVAHNVSYDLPLRYKTARHAPEKMRIGAAAAKLVRLGATIALNGGTTTSEVARAVALRSDLHDPEGRVTVVTNALNIASELVVRPHIKTVVVGGVARSRSYELIGPFAAATLQEVHVDVAILGVDGVDPVAGASAQHEGEAVINRTMAERAGRVVIVADSSKLGRRAFARICPVSRIDVLITDDDAGDEVTGAFKDAGVEIVCV